MVQSVAITGASSGLGASLAKAFAGPGVTLGLIGRDAARLATTAEACTQRGATVRVGAIDVTDAPALGAWLVAHDKAAPLDLLIANAGISAGPPPDATSASTSCVAGFRLSK